MKKLPMILLLAGFALLFLSTNTSITGAVIGTNIKILKDFFFILSLILFAGSLTLYVVNKSLESIVIPTGTLEADKKRVETAMKYYQNAEEKPYVLVTGRIQRDEKERAQIEAQQYSIYEKLRKHYGLNPSDLIIEGKSKDTLENFLYLIKKLKKRRINHIKIATNQTQYWRFKLFEKEAKKEGLIDNSFEVEPLYTNESSKELVYGVLAYVKDYFRIKFAGSLEKAKTDDM